MIMIEHHWWLQVQGCNSFLWYFLLSSSLKQKTNTGKSVRILQIVLHIWILPGSTEITRIKLHIHLTLQKNLLGLRNQLYTEVCILKFFKKKTGGHPPLLFGLLLLGEHFRITLQKQFYLLIFVREFLWDM